MDDKKKERKKKERNSYNNISHLIFKLLFTWMFPNGRIKTNDVKINTKKIVQNHIFTRNKQTIPWIYAIFFCSSRTFAIKKPHTTRYSNQLQRFHCSKYIIQYAVEHKMQMDTIRNHSEHHKFLFKQQLKNKSTQQQQSTNSKNWRIRSLHRWSDINNHENKNM